jgi:plastocyanin
MKCYQFWIVFVLSLVVTACSPSADSNAIPLPIPDIQFSADRSYIKVGMCVVFTWEVENGKAVYFYAEGEPWEDKLVSSSDSREECRTESTMYYLRVVGFDDAVEIRKIHIPVEPMPGL